MPRFVLLYHDCPPGYVRASHWDLMLESGDALETWALLELPRDWQAAHARTVELYPSCPPLATDNSVSAEHLAGHRSAYLDYEGPVGRERGAVTRVAAGDFVLKTRADDCWSILITEGTILGEISLERKSIDRPIWQLSIA